MSEYLAIPAAVSRIQTMADGSLRLQLDAQEIGTEQISSIFDLHQQLVTWLAVDTDKVPEKLDPPKPPKAKKSEETPSQRLRALLYEQFTEKGFKYGFEDFYSMEMNKIYELVKKWGSPNG